MNPQPLVRNAKKRIIRQIYKLQFRKAAIRPVSTISIPKSKYSSKRVFMDEIFFVTFNIEMFVQLNYQYFEDFTQILHSLPLDITFSAQLCYFHK